MTVNRQIIDTVVIDSKPKIEDHPDYPVRGHFEDVEDYSQRCLDFAIEKMSEDIRAAMLGVRAAGDGDE